MPQADGVIDEDLEPDPPTPDALRKAIEELKTKVAPGEVDVYVATLIAMDDEFWSGLTEVVQPAD